MSVDLSSLGKLSAVLPPGFESGALGTGSGDSATRIKQVSKAMETLFTSQLMSELGQNVSGISDDSSGGGVYQDFIQQAMTQGMTKGKGFGLAKQIENFLTQRAHPNPAPYMHPAIHAHAPNLP
jgi:Rod binding domain-containing protein